MNLPIEQFLPSGATLVGSVAGIVTVWFKFQNKVERLEETRAEDRRQIDALWKWKDDHVKEATDMRERMNGDISQLRGSTLVINEQFKQIMSALEDIKDRMSNLEGRRKNGE